MRLRLVRLPAYRPDFSPDFNADEHVWGWVRAEVTATTCFGTAATVREHVNAFLAGLATRTEEVKQRGRTVLQARANALGPSAASTPRPPSSHTLTAPLVPMQFPRWLWFSAGGPPEGRRTNRVA